MKTCKICGKEVVGEATVCEACGADLTETPETETVTEQTAAVEEKKTVKGFWAKLPFILNVSAIAVMAVALVCAFLTGVVLKSGEKLTWSFFDLMKNVKKEGMFVLGLTGVFTLIHIIVTVAMIILACVRFFVKKKDVFPCFAVVLATTLFSFATVANIFYNEFAAETKEVISLGVNGAGIAAAVIVILYFVVKALFDVIIAKREGKAIALKIVTALTTLIMCVALTGTSFAIYKRTYSDGDITKYALGGLFFADGVEWGNLKNMFKGKSVIYLMCYFMTLLTIVLLSVCLLLRNIKEKVKGVGRSYVIPSLIFYVFVFFGCVMVQSNPSLKNIAPTAILETVLIIVLLAMCITERVMQKKRLKNALSAQQSAAK